MALINCPRCERGQVHPGDPTLARCPACGCAPDEWVLKTLNEIASLPDATGTHACEECAHPQMKRLPDATFWCPACGQDILSLEATLALWEFRQKSEAYRRGWLDGYLLRETGSFSSTTRLVRWQGANERLDYYRGHRAGSQERFLLFERAGSQQLGSPSEKVRNLKEAS